MTPRSEDIQIWRRVPACAPLDLSKYPGDAYLILLLVCRSSIMYLSGNLVICDEDGKQFAPHGSVANMFN